MNENIKIFLVQRLRKPLKDKPFDIHSSFLSFGGGKENGGLSKEFMELIKNIFEFEYMGSAEFEWGAVPKALKRISENKFNVAFEVIAKTKEEKSGIVYVICSKDMQKDVVDWIRNKAFDEYSYRTKEYVGLQDVINGKNYTRTCGWLELDNGFFFFTDHKMFDDIRKLFGAKDQ